MSKHIALQGKRGQGLFVIVDDQDYVWLSSKRWYLEHGYAHTTLYLGIENGKQRQQFVYMHRLVAMTKSGQYTDHISGNRLDNRRANLRTCSNAENIRNQQAASGRTSKYRGVCWSSRYRCWVAQITVDYRHKRLGNFDSPEKAAVVWNYFARALHGDFARLNSVPSSAMTLAEQEAFLQAWLSTKHIRRANPTGFRGVYANKSGKTWAACVSKDGVRFHLGSYRSPEDAARAYNKKAVELYGSAALLNPTDQDETALYVKKA